MTPLTSVRAGCTYGPNVRGVLVTSAVPCVITTKNSEYDVGSSGTAVRSIYTCAHNTQPLRTDAKCANGGRGPVPYVGVVCSGLNVLSDDQE